MINIFTALLGERPESVKIFEGSDTPMPDFKIVATRVRVGEPPQTYVLDDGTKLKAVVEKWQFEPGGKLLRCGYDYQIEFRNGEVSIPVSVCFSCNSLVLNHGQVFKTSKKQILRLLEEDFKPL